MNVGQIVFLFILCLLFLFMVVLNNGLKYHIGVYKGRLAERLLRRMRYELFARIMRFPQPHFRRVGQGELVSMINAESEDVGNFTGAAIVDPVYLGGQLMVTLGFILVQNPLLGVAAASFYPIQAWIIPRLQRRVRELARQRIRQVRHLAEHIGETVSGSAEIRANDTVQLELSRASDRLGTIYNLRYQIFQRKFFIKFLNNFLDKLAPFFFYLIGGYFVITGDLTIGALLAVIAAHKDMSAPWKELLTWYQDREMARTKYEEVIIQFDPPDLLDEALLVGDPPEGVSFAGNVTLSNVSLLEEDGVRRLSGVNLEFASDQHVAVIGGPGSGKEHLAMLLARLIPPTSGRITIAGHDLATLPVAVTGRRIAYVGVSAFLQSSSVRDNLLYSIKHRPVRPASYTPEEARQRAADLDEAQRAGNLSTDFRADWMDYAEAGVDDEQGLIGRLIELLTVVEMDDDIYQMGLRGSIDPEARPDLAAGILSARRALRDKLRDSEYAELVEPFDSERYNTNATVAENLLFGTSTGAVFDEDNLADNEYVRDVLRKVGLYDDLLEVGRQVAQTMVELFADLAPGHEFFEQFSFISSEDLPDFKDILLRVERGGLDNLAADDRRRLLSLPFKLIPARHRLDLISEERRQRILQARHMFAEELPEHLHGAVEFFDPDRYNRAASLQDNILFGKLAYGQAEGARRIAALIGETLDALDARGSVMEAGLAFPVGIGGSRLSTAQRQKIALARALLRRADLLIVNEATDILDAAAENRVANAVLAERRGRGVLWVLNRPTLADRFDMVVVMEDGRVAERGPFDELNSDGTALYELQKTA